MPARSVAATTGSFVGRGAHLDELVRALGEAAVGRGSVALVSGEPGIGKTRLAQELAGVASARGAAVHWGTCWAADGAPPYWPWIQVIRSVLRSFSAKDILPGLGRVAEHLGRIVPDLGPEPGRDHPPGLAPGHERFQMFDAVATLLEATGQGNPAVVVLDDLHEADEPSLRLLAFVASRLPASRVLVMGTYRDVEVGPGDPLARTLAEIGGHARRLGLTGLTRTEVGEFIRGSTSSAPSHSLVDRVHRLTGGNPFFVQEIARSLPGDDEIGVPEGVRDVIERRLEKLSEECRAVLARAAVIGLEFEVEVLRQARGGSREEIMGLLAEAEEARIVRAVPGAEGTYAFSHALLRDAIYEDLASDERAAAHRRIGEVIEGLPGMDERLGELAHHFSAAGPVATGTAVDYAERAGRRALERLAYEEAAVHLERALHGLEALEPDEDRRLELLLALADAWKRSGAADRSREALGRAAELARDLGRPEEVARAAVGFRSVSDYYAAGTVDEDLIRLLEEALVSLPPGDSALRVRVMAQLAWEVNFADLDRSVTLARDAVDMGRRVGDPLALGLALDIWHAAVKMLERGAARSEAADEMVRLGKETGIEELALWGHRARVENFMEQGEIHKADAEVAIFSRLVKRLRDRSYEWWPAAWKTMRALFEGRFEEAERLANEALAIGGAHHGAALQHHEAQIKLIRFEQGRLEEMEPVVRAGVDAYPLLHLHRARLALLLAEMGRDQEARAQLERLAAHDFSTLPKTYTWDAAMAMLSELCGLLGDAPRAAVLYEQLEPFAGRWIMMGSTCLCRGPVTRYLGILAATMGKWERAEGHFEAALNETGRAGALPWTAHTQHEYARMVLARGGERGEEQAGVLLHEALETATRLGMRRLEALVRDLGASMAAEAPATDAASSFRRDGDVWTLAFAGTEIRMKDAKGLRDLATLLARPDTEIHVLDLVGITEGHGAGRPRVDDGLTVSAGGGAGSPLDERARSAYRSRLAELQAELDDAGSDPERAARAREEMDVLTRELAAAYGLGGRNRKLADPAERARKAVTGRIRDSIKRIGREHPALGRHLERSVRTGTFCRYAPDPPVIWVT